MPGSASTAVTTPSASATSRGVDGLVALHLRLRARLVERGARRLQRGLAPLQLGGADEALLLQLAEAPEVGLRLRHVDLGGGERGARRLLAEAHVLRVDLGEHLALLHPVADADVAARDLAADAKAEPRLDARAHLAGVLERAAGGVGGDHRRAHRAHRLGHRLRPGTAGERARRSRGSGGRRCGGCCAWARCGGGIGTRRTGARRRRGPIMPKARTLTAARRHGMENARPPLPLPPLPPPPCPSTTTRTSRSPRCCARRGCGRRCARSTPTRAPPTTSPTRARAAPAERLAALAAYEAELRAVAAGAAPSAALARGVRPARRGAARLPPAAAAARRPAERVPAGRRAARLRRPGRACSTTAGARPTRSAGSCCTCTASATPPRCAARTTSAPPCSSPTSGRTWASTPPAAASTCRAPTACATASRPRRCSAAAPRAPRPTPWCASSSAGRAA